MPRRRGRSLTPEGVSKSNMTFDSDRGLWIKNRTSSSRRDRETVYDQDSKKWVDIDIHLRPGSPHSIQSRSSHRDRSRSPRRRRRSPRNRTRGSTSPPHRRRSRSPRRQRSPGRGPRRSRSKSPARRPRSPDRKGRDGRDREGRDRDGRNREDRDRERRGREGRDREGRDRKDRGTDQNRVYENPHRQQYSHLNIQLFTHI